jgi:hypothetical protein
MGKKSKKGIPRATTKKHQHHAAGQGKTATTTSSKTLRGQHNNHGSVASSCDNSLDSKGSMLLNVKTNVAPIATISTNTANTNSGTTVHFIPVNNMVSFEGFRFERTAVSGAIPDTKEKLSTMNIVNNIEKENKSRSSTDPMTVSTPLVSNEPIVANVVVDESVSSMTFPVLDSVTDKTTEVNKVADTDSVIKVSSDVPIVVPEVVPCNDTTSTILNDVVVEEQTVASEDIAVEETKTIATPDKHTVATEDIAVEETAAIAQSEQQAVASEDIAVEETKTIARSEKQTVTASTEEEQTVTTEEEELYVESTQPAPINVAPKSSPDPQQELWSSTLRSIVSIDDDDDEEVLTDTPVKPKKAVIDVTPQKYSKLILPSTQTVSPSPDHPKASYMMMHTNVPIASLDTPDAKDMDLNAKQNECCIVM